MCTILSTHSFVSPVRSRQNGPAFEGSPTPNWRLFYDSLPMVVQFSDADTKLDERNTKRQVRRFGMYNLGDVIVGKKLSIEY